MEFENYSYRLPRDWQSLSCPQAGSPGRPPHVLTQRTSQHMQLRGWRCQMTPLGMCSWISSLESKPITRKGHNEHHQDFKANTHWANVIVTNRSKQFNAILKEMLFAHLKEVNKLRTISPLYMNEDNRHSCWQWLAYLWETWHLEKPHIFVEQLQQGDQYPYGMRGETRQRWWLDRMRISQIK